MYPNNPRPHLPDHEARLAKIREEAERVRQRQIGQLRRRGYAIPSDAHPELWLRREAQRQRLRSLVYSCGRLPHG